MRDTSERRSAGRPREFNREAALQAAMLVFWKSGFEGASLSDLTEAMGISKPSLYAAFESKEKLWQEALALYLTQGTDAYSAALLLPTVRQVAEAWLRLTGGVRDEEGVPPGCLLIQGALACTEASRDIQAQLATIRMGGVKILTERFERAKEEGDLPGSWTAEGLAQYLSALSSGLAVQSVSGVSRQSLNETVDRVMENWPSAAE